MWLDLVDAEAVGARLREELTGGESDKQATLQRVNTRLARLDRQRVKLVEMAYADAIPLDLLKSEQDRIARETEHAKRQRDEAERGGQATLDLYDQAQALLRRGAEIYNASGPEERRQLNRAFLAASRWTGKETE